MKEIANIKNVYRIFKGFLSENGHSRHVSVSYFLVLILFLQVNYASMDGSANNRAFLKMHFAPFDLETCDFTASSPYDPSHKVVMLMDPSVSN